MATKMLRKIYTSTFAVVILLIVCGFSIDKSPSTQPSEERKAQDKLPQSNDNMWKTLGKCTVHLDKKKYLYSIDYTPEVKAMEGKQITISGFMLPLEPTKEFAHFLLAKRTPTCAFCPPGAPNEIVEIFTKKPLTWDEGLVVVTGKFGFTSNPELGLFFQLKDADNIAPKSTDKKNNTNSHN